MTSKPPALPIGTSIAVTARARKATAAALNEPVQRMTLQELRDDLEGTRPAWDAEVAVLNDVLADGEHAALIEDAHRHQMVANELLRRPTSATRRPTILT